MLTRRQGVALVLLTLMWGINWPMMKFSLREMHPLWFRAVTMGGGVVGLMLWLRWRGERFTLNARDTVRIAWLAVPNIIGWHFFSIIGLRELASGRAAILGFTMPIWTVLIGALLAHEKLSPRLWLGMVCAAAAVGLLSAHELSALAGRPAGVLWMQLAAVSWAVGTLWMRRTTLAVPTEVVTVGMMATGALFFWLAAPLAAPAPAWSNFSGAMWASLAYGVFLNYGYAQIIWFGMARDLPPSASAFSIMAVPLVGTLSATAIVGERPGLYDVLAMAFVCVAIGSALLPRRPAPPPPVTPTP